MIDMNRYLKWQLGGEPREDFLRRLLFADIEDLPPTVQEKVFDEVLDRDVQKGRRGQWGGNFVLCPNSSVFGQLV